MSRTRPLATFAASVAVGCVLTFLLLHIAPAALVLKLLGIWTVACWLVDGTPRAWRAIRRR